MYPIAGLYMLQDRKKSATYLVPNFVTTVKLFSIFAATFTSGIICAVKKKEKTKMIGFGATQEFHVHIRQKSSHVAFHTRDKGYHTRLK